MLKSYADMLDKVQPSVVTILTGIETPQRRRMSREDIAMLRLLLFLPLQLKTGADRWQQIGIGSGVIVTPNGYILTNRHVIFPPDMNMDAQEYFDALRLRVNIPGREGYLPARVIDFLSDMEMDVAVVKIDGTDFPHATLADSDSVRRGDIAFALVRRLGSIKP